MGKQPAEVLYAPKHMGPRITQAQSHAHQWAGRTTLNSGSASVAVGTTAVKSDSIILFNTQVSSINVSANSGGFLAVNSVIEGTGFTFAWASGSAIQYDVTIMWEIMNTTAG